MTLPDLSYIVGTLDEQTIEPKLYPDASCWNDSSQGGFLAPREKLIDVVIQDYKTLTQLGVDYDIMANVASRFLSAQPHTKNFLQKLLPFLAPRNEERPYNHKLFEVSHISSMGSQSCPWGCDSDPHGYTTIGSGHVYIRKKVEGRTVEPLLEQYAALLLERGTAVLSEKGTSKKTKMDTWKRENGITFGGMDRILYLSAFSVITDLTPHLISTHYFFQGDASFRTDPQKLLEVYESRM